MLINTICTIKVVYTTIQKTKSRPGNDIGGSFRSAQSSAQVARSMSRFGGDDASCAQHSGTMLSSVLTHMQSDAVVFAAVVVEVEFGGGRQQHRVGAGHSLSTGGTAGGAPLTNSSSTNDGIDRGEWSGDDDS